MWTPSYAREFLLGANLFSSILLQSFSRKFLQIAISLLSHFYFIFHTRSLFTFIFHRFLSHLISLCSLN
ncbi:hypothetical protein HanRHA438_Chr04g0156571 [Helianthus annuus]|uniref:Uncharacterized protein n=1 Tax=Helianthus annuus TaxID=4232 RepID=A0A251TFY8_HELAN|nr:hypothetical protein HanHA300_Chr04g0120551 [Helianthus annuus]KAJ0586956.1 hypothetical protein HanIR_Chr04g0157671 [Helianthus annuus]KAJ0595573.1 hypothetical protein HanHA89_Chr04g0132831 [Helianthus annuus]KAJ0756228.1 hypothetical protein HanLR1_Chr04g0124651 [Helianthus annuus]KAJ0760005.1 hypothetical protein HanOQP8_Chr04g0132951 [Helianthus annuus]